MASNFQPSTPSQGDPSSTHLRKVFAAFLYDISDTNVLKEYYSKFGNIINIEKMDATTFMIEFEAKESSAETMYENSSKLVIINRRQNYIATTALINHDVSSEKCDNAENNKLALQKSVNISKAHPQTNMTDNPIDTTPRKSPRISSKNLIQPLKCQNITGKTFTCERFDIEARQELCYKKISSDKLVVDIILEMTIDNHLTIEKTLEKIKQYKCDFNSVEEEQLLLSRMEIISQIILLLETGVHFDALLIKPSKSLSVNVTHRPNHILLDSRISTCTKDAYMIKVQTMMNLEQETEQVCPIIPIFEGDVRGSFQADMLNTIDEFIVKLEPLIYRELILSINTTISDEKQKQGNEWKNNVNYRRGLIQSAKSQYTEGNVSGCVIYATEACLRLFRGETPSIRMIDEIISSFKTDFDIQHLAIEEVLTDVERFSKGLLQKDVRQIILANLEVELQRLINDNIYRAPFGLLLVKPPEAISLIVVSPRTFIIFDSHKRNNTTGAYFYIETDAFQVLTQITKIWPVTQTYFNTFIENNEQYQFDLLNMCEVHLVIRSETSEPPPLDISIVEKRRLIRETKEQKKQIDALRQQVHDLKSIIDAISNEKQSKKNNSNSSIVQCTTY